MLPSIPADFFEAGSDSSAPKQVPFQSESLKTAPGTPSLAPSDTVIERLAAASFSTCGTASVTIPIIMRGVHLKSAGPFPVTYNGGLYPEDWDVEICLSDTPQLMGTMTIQHQCLQGGTFTSNLPVRPKFVFIRRRDFLRRVLDPGDAGKVTFNGNGSWVHADHTSLEVFHVPPGASVDGNCDDTFESPLPGTSNFAVGIAPNPCNCSQDGTHSFVPFDEQAALNQHRVAQKGYVARPSDDRRSFPPKRDGREIAGFFRRHAQQGLALVIVLAIAAVIIPLRRPRAGG
jgi:hypothetical protein